MVHLAFDHGIRVNRLINDSSILDDPAFFPEASENAQGLTELICQSNGEHIVLESVTLLASLREPRSPYTVTWWPFLQGLVYERLPPYTLLYQSALLL